MTGKVRTYIILLRGVMPVGKNKVPMGKLREVLANDGFGRVRTYIASGNVLVDTGFSAGEVEKRIRSLIKKQIGPDLAVVARTAAQLQNVLDENPFTQGFDIARVFFAAFATQPAAPKVKLLLAEDFGPEKLVITKQAAYMYIPGTYGRMKLSNNYLEKKLGVSATTRNSNTLNKLIALSNE